MANVILTAILTPVKDLVPSIVQDSLYSAYHYLFSPKEITIIVDEHEDLEDSSARNQIFEAAMVYLPTKISPDTRRFKVSKTPTERSLKTSIEPDVKVIDRFDNNVELKWKLIRIESEHETKRFFELSFQKKYMDRVLDGKDGYLESMMREAEQIVNNMEKVVKIHGNPIGCDQGSLTFNHPITFEKLAMDPKFKQAIIDDLDRFSKGQEFYRKVGKAWKRGYLLHGPPGTGKSSLIAAMANHLKYDVYALEFASFHDDKDLRRILVSTPNRSILVIEDIDCNVEMQVRRTGTEGSNHKLTLSGLLNFIDGLWSCCGDERIIVVTTNYKDRLDSALLRPGRIDMEIHMSYCTRQGFRLLASNYLNMDEDPRLFGEIEVLIANVEDLIANVEVTPAEIAGQLMRSEDAVIALAGVVDFLKRKMEANEIEEDKNGHEMREPTRLKIEEDKVNGPEVREQKEVAKITEGLSEEEKVSSS